MSDNRIATYKHWTVSGWVKDFFETIAHNVYMGDGSTVEEKIEEVEDSINEVGVKSLDNEARIEEIEDYIDQTKNKIYSHVGMVIQSTTLNTMAKVIAIYGGTSWKKIEGRIIIGADTDFPAGTTGGSKNFRASGKINNTSGLDLNIYPHSPGYPRLEVAYGNYGLVPGAPAYNGRVVVGGTSGNLSQDLSHGHIEPISVTASKYPYPPYKAVYIWERTA